MDLRPQPRSARTLRRPRHRASHDPAADAEAQRQGRALPADPRPRMGLRAALPRLRHPRRSAAHLAGALQLHSQPQLALKPAAHQPRSGPAEARHLVAGHPARADRLARGDQLARAVEVGGAVDRQHRAHAAVLEVPDGERPGLDVAADDLLVPGERRADVLDRRTVGEVGEEVRDDVVRRIGAEHVARGRRTLGHRDVLVLDAHDAAVEHAVELADVAGREHALGRHAAQAAVAAHAAELAELEAGAAREHDVGLGADAADDRVALEHAAALRQHPRDAALVADAGRRGLEAVDLVAADDLDAVLLEDGAEPRAGAGAELALQRLALLHEDRDALAELRQRRRDLGADVGAADADDPLRLLDVAAQRVGVAERAEVVDPG